MKIGDKVRFLSEVGGGVVTGFRGKDIVLVNLLKSITTTDSTFISEKENSLIGCRRMTIF